MTGSSSRSDAPALMASSETRTSTHRLEPLSRKLIPARHSSSPRVLVVQALRAPCSHACRDGFSQLPPVGARLHCARRRLASPWPSSHSPLTTSTGPISVFYWPAFPRSHRPRSWLGPGGAFCAARAREGVLHIRQAFLPVSLFPSSPRNLTQPREVNFRRARSFKCVCVSISGLHKSSHHGASHQYVVHPGPRVPQAQGARGCRHVLRNLQSEDAHEGFSGAQELQEAPPDGGGQEGEGGQGYQLHDRH